MRPKRIFVIVFSLFFLNAGILTLCLQQLVTITNAKSSSVKDISVITPNVSQEQPAPGTVETIIPKNDKPVITTYVVKSGDNLSSIASQFDISTNTILWANDLTKKSVIRVGQKLTILPVSGVIYVVAKGDVLGSIALKFDASVDEIVSFNNLENNKTIRVGQKLIIPNAELPSNKDQSTTTSTTPPVTPPAPKPVAKTITPTPVVTPPVVASISTPAPTLPGPKVATVNQPTIDIETGQKTVIETTPVSKDYFTHPIPGSILTQGPHGYNAIDFGAPVGTPVLAAADGTVIVAKGSGYNGGYGKYVVIEHDNGTQTLYGHLSKVLVSVDDQVTQGSQIALSGNTGHSTGPHLHFEVRGGVNPWASFKKGTQF